MAKKWAEVAGSSEFQALPSADQEATRMAYFREVVAPQVPAADLDATFAAFDADTKPGLLKRLAGAAAPVASAVAQAARGVHNNAVGVAGELATPTIPKPTVDLPGSVMTGMASNQPTGPVMRAAPPPPAPAGLLVAGNVDLTKRPRVQNADGSVSTVRSISVNIDGKETLIPTVSDDGRILTNDQAVELYRRTGKHLGQFATPAAATAYAKQLHADQAAGEPTRTGSFAQDARVQRRLEDDAAQRNINLAQPGGVTAGIPAGQPGDVFQRSAAQTAAAIGTQIGDISPHAWSAGMQFYRGLNPDQKGGWPEEVIARSKALTKSRLRPGSEDYATAIPGLSFGDVATLGENLGFSAPIMATAAVAGILGPVLGAAAVPSLIAGIATKVVEGGVAFWGAYRIAGNQFQRTLRETLDETRKAAGAKPISDEEWAASQKWWDPLAKAYGLYEGGGEAAGNVAALAILRSKVTGTLGRLFGKATATRFITKMGFGSTIEVLSEAETQLGQHNVEVQAGMTKGPERSFLSPKDQAESVREVAVPTLLQTAVFGAATGVGHQVKRQATGEAQQELRDKVDARTRKWQTERADTTAADAIAKWGTQGLTPSTGAAPPAPPAAPPAPPAAPGAAAAPKAPVKPMPPPTAAPTVYAEDMPDLSRQNRDRGRAISVGQIASIANAPDYDRAGVSNSSELGAPMVSVVGNAPTIPEAQIGREERVIFPDGKVPARYAVVEAGSVLASHTADGAPVAEYGKPAPGAVVALNNARTIGLTAGYARGTAASYRAALAADPRHGIAPEVIAGMKEPILVRLYDDKVNENMDLGRRSNAPHAMGLSGPERAMNDARLLDVGKLTRGQGDVLHDDNAAFIRSFIESVPANERADLTAADGTYSKQLRGRIEDALFARAYRSPELVSLAVENADPEIGNVLRAMRESAPAWARLPAMGELDLRTAAVHGAWALVDAKARGLKPTEVLRQADAFGTDPDQAWFTRMFVENNRSPKRMADYLRAVAEVAEVELSERGSMFEPAAPKTKEQILGQATERTAAATAGAAKLPRRGQTAQNPGGRAGEGEQPGRGRTTPEGSGPVEVTDLPLAARIKRPTEDLSGGLFGEAPPAAPPKPAAPAPDYGLKSQTPAEIRAAAAAKEAAAKAAAKPPPATGPKVKVDQADLLAPQDTLFPAGTREPTAASARGAGKVARTADGMPPKDRPIVLVFGGTYNPPTLGHVRGAEEARKHMESLGYTVQSVILTPVAQKAADAKAKAKGEPSATVAQRAAMLRLAIDGHPGLDVAEGPALEAADWPAELGKLRRTQTADWVAARNPGATIINVTGQDQPVEGTTGPFPQVHMGAVGSNHDGYFYLVLPREDESAPGYVSSSGIRREMLKGLPPPPNHMNPAVEAYYRDKVLRPLGIKPAKVRVERANAQTIVVNGKEYPLTWKLPATPRALAHDDPLMQVTFADGLPPEALFDPTVEGSRAAEREEWRRGEIDAHFAGITPVEGRKPILFVLAGGGGSGKGWVKGKLKDFGAFPRDDQNAVLLDVDDIKLHATEWAQFKEKGEGRGGSRLHEESAAMGKLIQAEARKRGVDFVLDATMANTTSGLLQLEAWRDAGYEIRMHAVATDPQTAVIRAYTRATENNRWVPWAELLKAHKKLAAGIHSYAGKVDQFWIWDGNSSDPTLLAKSGATSVGLEVVDDQAYNRWRRDGQRIQVTTANEKEFNDGEKTLHDVLGGISEHHQQDRQQGVFGEPRGPGIAQAGVGLYEESGRSGEPGKDSEGRAPGPVNAGGTNGNLAGNGDADAPGGKPGPVPDAQGPGETPVVREPKDAGPEPAGNGPGDEQQGGPGGLEGGGLLENGPGDRPAVDAGPGARPGGRAGVPAGRDIPAKSGRNFAFGAGDLSYTGSWLVKAKQNLDALKLLRKLETEQRQATREEQAALALYVGWGASEIRNKIFDGSDKLDDAVRLIESYERAIEEMGDRLYVERGSGRYSSSGAGFYPAFEVINAKRGGNLNYYSIDRITRAELEAAKPSLEARKWVAIRDELQGLLSETEWAEASRSTQYAHYTSKAVVEGMWHAVERMGFRGGAVLEPGAGIGVFPGLMGPALATNSIYTGIEYEPVAGGILKQLFPDERIVVGDFTKIQLPRDFYDMAIGNPPFSDTKIVSDREYRSLAFPLHDYFAAKTLDSIKPGGLMVFVSSRYTLDKLDSKARDYLAERADLLGAIRLPQTAFKKNAGTEVVTDVIFLRKKVPGETFTQAQPWQKTADAMVNGKPLKQGKATVQINEYFAAHPEMVLGTHSLEGSMYAADTYTVKPMAGNIEDAFRAAVELLPANVYRAEIGSAAAEAQARDLDLNPLAHKEGGYYLSPKGVLMRTHRGQGTRADNQAPLLIDYIPVRDALKQAQLDQLNDGDWEKSLAELKRQYERFVAKHGRVLKHTAYEQKTKVTDPVTGEKVEEMVKRRRFAHQNVLSLDPDYSLVAALEVINEETDAITLAPFLASGERTLEKPKKPKIETVPDALLATLNEIGHVDVGLIAAQAGVSEAAAIDALAGQIYQAPDGRWQTADEYLSGDVRKKLEDAMTAAASDRRFEPNVEALRRVQPREIGKGEINVKLGMPIIPLEDIEQFGAEVLKVNDLKVTYTAELGRWDVAGNPWQARQSPYSTARADAVYLLHHALTSAPIELKTWQGTGKDAKEVLDEKATAAAQQKVTEIKDEFRRWLHQDEARSDAFVRKYNATFNTIVARQFDGRHLTLPGTSRRKKIFDHVKRGAWRIIQDGNTYLAHAVGSGKTYQMVISAMEQKRLGLINKPMFVVPLKMLAQFEAEWMELYPTARLMVADEKDFHTSKRQEFVSRAALTDLDGIIIAHSTFGLLDLDPAFKQRLIQEELDRFRAALIEAGGDPDQKTYNKAGKRTYSRDPKIRDLERAIESLEQKMQAAADSAGKDQKTARFDEMGVDFLYVDEGHKFRRLAFPTKMQVKGIQPAGSQKAFDLWMKTRWLEERKPGRSLVMASGTPVTNTLAELYTVLRLMDPKTLADRGIALFDQWAAMFGREDTRLEPDPGGKYEQVSRFVRFANMPELAQMFRKFADVLTSEDLARILGDKRPKVKGGSRKMITAPMTPALREYRNVLRQRVEDARAWRPTPDEPSNPDPIIRIIGHGRLSAIDMRYVEPLAPNDPSSKLNKLCDEVLRIYNETKDNVYANGPALGATQVIFSDYGLGAAVTARTGFDAKRWVIKRLREGGVKPDEIAFINDYHTAQKQLQLYRRVNQGKVKIVVGASDSLGTGVNIQERLIAAHHLDAVWVPANIEQREGRIIRVGNQNPVVETYVYATKGSYDEQMWSLVATKQRMIDQTFSGDPNLREIEDMSEASAFEEASAMLADDPRVPVLAGLRAEVERLSNLARAAQDDRLRAQRMVELSNMQIERLERRAIPAADAAAKKVVDLSGDNFTAKVEGKSYATRKDWGMALLAAAKARSAKLKEGDETIGEMSGFPIVFSGSILRTNNKVTGYEGNVWLSKGESHLHLVDAQSEAADPVGLAMRASNAIVDMAREPERLRALLAEERSTVHAMTPKITAEFPFAAELLEKSAAVTELEEEIRTKPYSDAEEATEPDYTLADYAAVGAGADLSGAAAMAARRPAAIEAAQLLSENRWEKVEEAREWLTDDRSHGDSYVAEAANEVYQAHGGERYGRSKAVLEYVTEAVERSRAMRAEDGEAVAVRGTNYPKALPHAETKKLAEAIVAGWTVKPKLEVLHSLDEAPAEVGAYFGKLDAKTTQGPVAAFFWRDTVYVLSNAMATRSDVIRYVQHEGLGHFGLRQTYGQAGMGKILTELVAIRGPEVKAKALAYGFDWNNPMDRGIAAEEYLVEMAETRPTMGFVKRAITAIRTWARLNVPGFESLKVTDAEIIREWILPARARIERGRPAIWPRELTRKAAAPTGAARRALAAARPVPPMPDVDALYPRTAPGASAEAKQQFDAYVAAMETWRRGLEAAAEGEDAIALKADDGKIRLVTANAHYGAVPDARPFRVTIIDGETWEPDYHTEHDTMAEALEGAAWDIRHATKKTNFQQIPVAARALHAVAMGDEKGYSALDRRLIDYKPDRSLADAKETELIADTVPNARFVPYSAVPFFDQLNRLQGTPDPEQTSTQDYIDARYKLFNALPEIEAPMDKLVVTQDVVNRERIDSMMAKLPKQGGAPIMAVRYGGETYILDGHHRVVAKDKRGDGVVNARLLNLDAPATEVPRAARVRSAMQTVADLFSAPRIPLAKPTRVGDPYGNVDHPLVFSSGMSRASDFGPALGASHSIGVDAGEVSANAAAAIAQGMARSNGFLYVDSGAFALFRAQQRAQKAGDGADLAKLAKQIRPLNFDQVFARYDRLAEAISRADPDGYASDRVFYTMPDVIGDQQASLDLLRRYKEDTHSWIRHMQTVVPLQAGELSLTEYYDQVVGILGTELLTVGIPSAAKAVSDEDFAALLRDRGNAIFGVHILGAASEKTAGARLEVLRAASYDGHVSLDANRLRGLWNAHSTRPEALDRLLYGLPAKRKGEATTPVHPARAEYALATGRPLAARRAAAPEDRSGDLFLGSRTLAVSTPAEMEGLRPWDYETTAAPPTKAEAQAAADALAKLVGRVWLRTSYGYMNPGKLKHVGVPDGNTVQVTTTSRFPGHRPSDGYFRVFMRDGKLFEQEGWGDRPEDHQWARVYVLNGPFGPTAGESWGAKPGLTLADKPRAATAVAAGPAPGLRPSRGILDTALRVPMQVARLDKLTSATWDLMLELGGRVIPERVKAGVVSDYGVPADVTDRREVMESGMAKGTRQTQTILDKLATLTRAETRVLYQAATTPDAHLVDYYLRDLPAESRAVLLEIKALVRALGQEQVDLGYLPREVFARNEWSYLHRTYLDKEAQETDGEKRARLGQRRLLADAYKGRGISDSLAAAAIERVAPDWWGRKFPKGVATADLVGENFVRMELRDPPLPGMTRGKLKDVVYFPAGEPLPATLNPYSRDAEGAIWTVRDVKGGDAIVHRDFMPAERERMGEIDDIRYAIAKTLHLAINNVEVGRFLKYLADRHSKVLPPAGAVTREGKDEGWARYGAWGANEWARVPETMLPGTSVKRYGALAGRWLPGAIWNEARGVVTWQRSIMPEWYQSVLRGWKISRTALSPTVHMNNIVSNFVFADWSNVDARHIARAAWTLLRSKSDPVAGALVADYMDNGGQAGTWALTDLQRQQLEPILKELLAGAGQSGPRPLVGLLVALQKARAGDFEAAWEAVKQGKGATTAAAAMRKMIHLYQGEDDLFRLAAFIKAREDGLNDHDAGHFARKAFLDYRINAPWIQAMRQTAFPFIAFTYRALPMLLHAGATQPWKLAKLLGVLGALNALAYAMLGGDGDEEQERRWLPEEKAGRLWGVGPHKLMRMPWNNAQGDPVFLDVRRFIPIGDFFDTGQNHAAMPWLPVLVPAGPAALAVELLANRSQFTGQDIVQLNVGGVGGDTPAQAAAKIADHLFKAFAPNLMVPGPGTVLPVDRGQLQTYSWQTVLDAMNGATDTFGRTVSVPQAIAGGVGIKIGAYSREAAGQRLQIETSKALEQVRIDMRRTARQEQTGKVSAEDAAARQETNRAKIKAIQERVSERLP